MRVYLDNAATSWPKPPGVYEAVDRWQREVGAVAGRGAYDSAVEASRVVGETRTALARLIGAGDPSRIIFTANGTEALNLAIFGIVEEGDHVVTTVCEHNSVLRPLALLRETKRVRVDYVPCDSAGVVDPANVASAILPETKLVAVASASNVTGAGQPLQAIGSECRQRGALFLVDAAQSLGHAELNVAECNIDLLASPGHKALMGPLGTGLLYIGPALKTLLQPLHYGGTGVNSDEESPPEALPERYEAGNLNIPALAGLGAGVSWLDQQGDAAQQATASLIDGLAAMRPVQLYGPTSSSTERSRAPVVSFTIEGYDPQEVAAILAAAGVECRAGLHCAPRMHRALGTDKRGGTIRLSPGPFTTSAQVSQTLSLIEQLAASFSC